MHREPSIANHSPEIAYLRHGENGLLVADSTAAFAEAVSALMHDPAKLAAMRAACLRDAQVYTLQAMVDRFAGGVRECLANPVAEAVQA